MQPPPEEDDLPPPEPVDAEDAELLRQLEEIDPMTPSPAVNGSARYAKLFCAVVEAIIIFLLSSPSPSSLNITCSGSQKPIVSTPSANSTPVKADVEMRDAGSQPTLSQPQVQQPRSAPLKRPLPPPPPLDALPPVPTEAAVLVCACRFRIVQYMLQCVSAHSISPLLLPSPYVNHAGLRTHSLHCRTRATQGGGRHLPLLPARRI